MPTISIVPCLDKTRQVQWIKREESFYTSNVDSGMTPMSIWHASDVDSRMHPMSTVVCLRSRQWHASNIDSSMPTISTLLYLHKTKQVPLIEKREESYNASDVNSGMPLMSTLLYLRDSEQVPLTEVHDPANRRRVSMPVI
ncbi:hypothetical protein EV426DRAFT_712714 [Tirmania nivea]|nr:hypothetical protein EV426DRAFT_712714 [Tirmania nivea]